MLLLGRGLLYDDARVPDRIAERFVPLRIKNGVRASNTPTAELDVDPQMIQYFQRNHIQSSGHSESYWEM